MLVDRTHPSRRKDGSSTCIQALLLASSIDESNLPSDVSACKTLTAFEDISCCMDLPLAEKAITVSSVYL